MDQFRLFDLRLLKLGELHNIPQVLLDYRQHFKSVNYSSNHEDRKKLHEKLMQEHCEAAHKPLPELKRAVHEKTREEVYAQWANWALEDNFYKTFWIYTLTIISLNPFSFKNWRQSFCLLFLFWIRMIKKIKNKSMRFS